VKIEESGSRRKKKKDSPGSAADLGSDERGIWELREKNKSLHISNSKNQTQFLK